MKIQKNWQATIALVLRILLASVFLYAGLNKMGQPREMAASIIEFQLVPESLIWPLSLGLPLFECNLAIMMLTGIRLRISALGISLLCGVFTIAVAQAWIRGIDINCNCFGEVSDTPISVIFFRDLALLAVSLWLLKFAWSQSHSCISKTQAE